MIRVQVTERAGRISDFSVAGHAGYAERGRDVVCAAVSALTLNAVNSCEHLLGIRLECRDDGDTLRCRVPLSPQDTSVQLLLRSMVFGLEQTARAYPGYVRIRFVRERSKRDEGGPRRDESEE